MTEHSGTSQPTADPAQRAAQTAAPSSGTPVADGVVLNPILSQLREALGASDDVNSLVRQMSGVICENTECLALWLAQRSDDQANWQLHTISDDNAAAVAEHAGQRLFHVVQAAYLQRTVCSMDLESNFSIVAAAVDSKSSPLQISLVGVFSDQSQSSTRHHWMMSMAVQSIGQWFQQLNLHQSQSGQKLLGDSLSVVSSMNRSTTKQEAANNLVNQLRQLLSASQVAWCEGRTTDAAKLVAVSEVEKFDPHSDSSRVIAAAAARAIGREEPLVFHQSSRPEATDALSMEAYCKANRFASCVCVGVLDRDGQPCGSLLVASDNSELSEHQVAQIQQFANINGLHLDIVQRANLTVSEFVTDRVRSVPKKKWFRGAMWAAAAFAGLMLIPMPYRVGCECEIQPSIRRFVAAPYQGALEKSLVSPGEAVVKDQIMAMMDGRQLRHELTGLKAEYNASKKRRDSALAQGEVAQSQISRSEMRRLDSQIQSLEDQLKRLEVRSPYDGIVISGDLEKAQGAPMEMGQTLFEVAPAGAMLAEISIPESEIQYVQDQNHVAIKLNAFPFQTFKGQIGKIHPSAEVLDDESVFVAEVTLAESGIEIRPGMKGSAKVSTFWRPLGWNLFHNAWETIRCWTIW